jgi:hypothetical protein
MFTKECNMETIEKRMAKAILLFLYLNPATIGFVSGNITVGTKIAN